MNKINVAVIGTGYWGRKLIGEYQDCNNFNLVAICDVKEEYMPQDFKGKKYTEFEQLAKDLEIKAVHLATPNWTHYSLAKLFLDNDKHVLVEKPFTLDSNEAKELIDLAGSKKLILKVGHIFRFNNAVNKAKEIIKSGLLGRVLMAKFTWSTQLTPLPQGRDVLFDLAPHPIDISNNLFGEWPNTVKSVSKSIIREEIGLEEYANIFLEHDSGIFVSIEVSWISIDGKKVREFKVLGTKRNLIVDPIEQTLFLYNPETHEEEKIIVEKNNTMLDEIYDFSNAINGLSSVENSSYVGYKTVQVLEQTRNVESNNFSKITGIQYGYGTKIRDQVNLYGCKIGKNSKIDSFVYIEENVEIGDNTNIRPYCFIPSGTKIGNNVFVGPGVRFTNDKYPKAFSTDWKLLPIIVEDNVSIGAGSIILPGVKIGKGAMIGAGSIVTKDVLPNSKIYGNPAK